MNDLFPHVHVLWLGIDVVKIMENWISKV